MEVIIKIDRINELLEAIRGANATNVVNMPQAPSVQQVPTQQGNVPVMQQPPIVAPPAPQAPVQAPVTAVPVQQADAVPVGQVPVMQQPTYSIDAVAKATADLCNTSDQVRQQVLALLQQHGVQALTQLQGDALGAFVTEIRAMGARI